MHVLKVQYKIIYTTKKNNLDSTIDYFLLSHNKINGFNLILPTPDRNKNFNLHYAFLVQNNHNATRYDILVRS